MFYTTSWLLFAISFEHTRAIYKPLAGRLSGKVTLLSTIFIITCSFALHIKQGMGYKYVSSKHTFINSTVYEYSECLYDDSIASTLTDTIIAFTIGMWLPMLMILVVYISMYMMIRKQAFQRRLNSSYDSRVQMMQISCTFPFVIAVYYICYLPHTIIKILNDHSISSRSVDHNADETTRPFTNYLIFSNSCLNPLIYSKIHLKVYKIIRNTLNRSNCKLARMRSFYRKKSKKKPSKPVTNNLEMFIISKEDDMDSKSYTDSHLSHGDEKVYRITNQ